MSNVTAIASWYGSNRMLGKHVGEALRGCEFVAIPFAGGMAEVPHIEARTINVNDLHGHIINLAEIAAHPTMGPKLYRELRRIAFHPQTLTDAQRACPALMKTAGCFPGHKTLANFLWAREYFICAWMTRHGSAGTPAEFTAGISTRWNSNGGDSAAHFQGAIRAINSWRRTLRRCNFTCLDFREFLGKVKDQAGHGVYCDSPFPGPGDKYTHHFSDDDHRELARLLTSYEHTRIVCRFYDVPFVRELYPEPSWSWNFLEGRKQTNDAAPEVLIVKNGAV